MNTTSSTFPDSNTAANAAANTASRAHQMVDNVAEKAAPTVQSATSAAHQAIDKVATAGAKASDWVSANSKQLADTSGALSDACSGYVRARPLMTVAGAWQSGISPDDCSADDNNVFRDSAGGAPQAGRIGRPAWVGVGWWMRECCAVAACRRLWSPSRTAGARPIARSDGQCGAGCRVEGQPNAKAADGLVVTSFAAHLQHPRWLYVLPNGDVRRRDQRAAAAR